jgi:hypothetical protein
MNENDEQLRVLTTVMHEFEGQMIVGALQREGIPATATGEFISNFKAEAPGNVRVLVKHADLDRATAILDEVRQARDKRVGGHDP